MNNNEFNENQITEAERVDAKKAILYDLRLALVNSEKETFTKDEILELLDQTAINLE